jgi:hypothetical protein
MYPREQLPQGRLPQHIFTVGQRVRFLPEQTTVRRPQQESDALYAASFEIVRLLPRAESRLYYRIRDVASGQERVASEQEITSTPNS